MRAVCIVNRDAGGGLQAAELRPAFAALRRAGLRLEVVEVGPSESPRGPAREAVRAGAEVVIAAGGDGTIARVASGLVGGEVPLGILPFGTYMNLARSLDVPTGDPVRAARVIARGNVRRIDHGVVARRRFFEAAGVGLDALTFRVVNAVEQGKGEDAVRTFDRLVHTRAARVAVTVDGERHVHRATSVLVMNAPYYAWGLSPLGQVAIDDGALDVAIFEQSSWVAVRGLLAPTSSPAHERAAPHRYRGEHIEVRLAGAEAHADGRPAGRSPWTFDARPRSLAVCAPRPR